MDKDNTKSSNGLQYSDSEIFKCENDLLGRCDFSHKIANAISNYLSGDNAKDCFVIGIDGEWGEGKTSVMNMIEEKIEYPEVTCPLPTGENREEICAQNQQAREKADNTIKTLKFSPWLYNDNVDLHKQFFEEIGKQIGTDTEKNKKLEKKLKNYSDAVNAISTVFDFSKWITIATTLLGLTSVILVIILSIKWMLYFAVGFVVISIITQFIKDFFNSLSFFTNSNIKKTPAELKDEINEELEAQRLLIIIDDIDRLNKEQVRDIFQLIKSNADFNNTVYLLSYDRILVQNCLSEDAYDGKDYLQKIVQMHYKITPTSEFKIRELFLEEVENCFAKLPDFRNYLDDSEHWIKIQNCIYPFFKNLRDLKRFHNELSIDIISISDNNICLINPYDFVALEVIKHFEIGVYNCLKNNISQIVDLHKNSDFTLAKELKGCFDSHGIQLNYRTFNLLKVLFPYFEHSEKPSYMENVYNPVKRLCSTNYCKTYFSLIVGGDFGKITKEQIDNLLDTSSTNFNKYILNIFKTISQDTYFEIFTQIYDRINDENTFNGGKLDELITTYSEIYDSITVTVPETLKDRTSPLVNIIIALIFRSDNYNKNKSLLIELIKENQLNEKGSKLFRIVERAFGLFTPVHFCIDISSREASLEFDEFTANQLKGRVSAKIKYFLDRDLIEDNRLKAFYMAKLTEWRNLDYVKDTITRHLEDDEAFVEYLSYFTFPSKKSVFENAAKVFVPVISNGLGSLYLRVKNIKDHNEILYNRHKEKLDIIKPSVTLTQNIETPILRPNPPVAHSQL